MQKQAHKSLDEIRDQLFCPGYESDTVHERVEGAWEYFGPVPVPKFDMTCPQCGSGEDDIFVRFASFGVRDKGGVKYRCDWSVKCVSCFCLNTFGIPISDEQAEQAMILFDIDDITVQTPQLVEPEEVLEMIDQHSDLGDGGQ